MPEVPTWKPTKCDRCGDTFSSLTDELAYYAGNRTCETCGAGPHWEHGADRNSLATNTPQDTIYCLCHSSKGRPKVKLLHLDGGFR